MRETKKILLILPKTQISAQPLPCLQEIVNDDNGNNDNDASDDASPQVISQINKVCLWSGASQVASPASEFYIRSATSFLPRNMIFFQNFFCLNFAT